MNGNFIDEYEVFPFYDSIGSSTGGTHFSLVHGEKSYNQLDHELFFAEKLFEG